MGIWKNLDAFIKFPNLYLFVSSSSKYLIGKRADTIDWSIMGINYDILPLIFVNLDVFLLLFGFRLKALGPNRSFFALRVNC